MRTGSALLAMPVSSFTLHTSSSQFQLRLETRGLDRSVCLQTSLSFLEYKRAYFIIVRTYDLLRRKCVHTDDSYSQMNLDCPNARTAG